LIPVFLGVSIFAFTLSHCVGDPIAVYVTEQTPRWLYERIREKYHLNDPLYVQYIYWLKGIAEGDWGMSRAEGRSVVDCVREYFPATFELAIFSLIFSLAIGIPLGIISAVKKDKPIDHGTRIFALTGVSIPIFWLGLMLQFILFYQFKVLGLPYFPQGHRYSIFVSVNKITGLVLLDSILTGNVVAFTDALWHIVMPAFCLGYMTSALITRMMRSSMLEVLRQDYITLARSKGLPERIVIYKHALKNAMVPTVTVTGIAFGGLLSGAVLTETVFSWPGLGRWATFAIQTMDFAAIMGFIILVSFIYVLVNLIVDILYAMLDPRVRYG
jgi:peptide/nickel transport system permease protein